MFLGSGVDANNNLIYIDQVRRGKTNLKCPYCGGFLTAKKGRKKEHHFAHTEKNRNNFYRCAFLDIPNILDISGMFMFSRSLDPNYAKKMVREMKRIPLKYLSFQEQAILNDELFEIEKKEKFSTAVKTGMQQAKNSGIHIGRPKDKTESTRKFLAKPKNKAIASVLKKGLSLRQTAKETGAAINTIRKVKAALENGSTINS